MILNKSTRYICENLTVLVGVYCLIITSHNFPYSLDCVQWGLLPVVTESTRHNCSFVKGRFTGDPSYEYEHTETKKVENQDGERLEGAEEENIVSKD